MSIRNPIEQRKEYINQSVVYQHNELIEATYKMSIGAKRLMLMMIASIDPIKGPTMGMGRIDAPDYAETCGIENNTAYAQLKEAGDNLFNAEVRAFNPKTKVLHKFRIITGAEYDEGSGCIRARFSQDVLPYIKDLCKHFTRFELANAVKFKRFYTIRLYELLMMYNNPKSNRFYEVSVPELRTILAIDDKKTYNNFAKLNEFIIKPSLKEIEQKTTLDIEVLPKRHGRKITHLRFIIKDQAQMDMFKDTQARKARQEVSKLIKKIAIKETA